MQKATKFNIKPLLLIPFILVWAIILVVQSCKVDRPDTVSFNKDTVSAQYIHENFVGSESCKSCHESEFEEWYTSHHAKAMAEANDSTVLGDFNNKVFESKGITSTFFRKDKKYYVNTAGGDGALQDFEIVYTFGYTPLQQYLVRFPNGRYQTLHLSWDSEKDEWFEQYKNDTFPGWDWLHWTRGAMTWNSMCADCHSTNVQKNYSSETDSYQTSWSIINVSCEACHGPGKQHIEYVTSKGYDSTSSVKGSFLKLTGDLAPIQQIEQCAPCHSRRTQITSKYDMEGRFLDHFVSEILREEIYYADGQIKDEDYVYGSFLQSKMFQNGVKCSNCHNVHSGNLLLTGNALCTQCHIKETFDTPVHHFHPENSESSQCVNCHMTGKIYMGNDFRRDHSFRIPRPDQSLLYDVPNACSSCHSEKSIQWAKDAIVNWYGPVRKPSYTDMLVGGARDPEEFLKLARDITQPPITRATAIYRLMGEGSEDTYQTTVKSLSDKDGQVRITAINALAYLDVNDRIRLLSPLLMDPVRSVRIAAVSVLADVNKVSLPLAYQEGFDRAINEQLERLKQNEDFSMGQYQLGQYYDQKGIDSLALKAYRRAIEIDSLNSAPRINLARLYNKIGRNDLAIRTLNDLVNLEPSSVDGFYYLGLVYAEEGKVNEAISAFNKAIELSPLNPRYYYNLGLILHQNGRPDEAERVFKKGLDLIPDADDIRYALATSYAENNKNDLALEQALILEKKYPQNQNLKQLVNLLKEKLVN